MKTWLEMRTEIEEECNISGGEFVSSTELMTWANDAKDECKAKIVSLFDRYLETDTTLALVTGTSTYDLPTDIYANKITGIYYSNGSEKYEIAQIKQKTEIIGALDNDSYKYRITNSTASGTKLKLVPASRETSSSNVTIFYIRDSVRITADDDYMDLPIADGYIKQYIKDKVKEKELGPLSPSGRSAALEAQERIMIEALNQMIPDDSTDKIIPDLSFYDEYEGF